MMRLIQVKNSFTFCSDVENRNISASSCVKVRNAGKILLL